MDNIRNIEASACHVKSNSSEERHRLISHSLHKFSLRSKRRIWRIGAVCRKDQKHISQRMSKKYQQDISACIKDTSSKDSKNNKSYHERRLHPVYNDRLLLEKLQKII